MFGENIRNLHAVRWHFLLASLPRSTRASLPTSFYALAGLSPPALTAITGARITMLSLVPALLVAWLSTAQAIVNGRAVNSVPGYLAEIEWEVVSSNGSIA